MSQPKPAPRKRNVAPQSSSPSVTRKGSGKGLDVKGIRSKLDEMSMQQLRDILEDAGALHGVISTLNVPQLDSLQKSKEDAAAENRRIAEENLEYRPQLEDLRNELTTVELTVNSLMEVHAQYYEKLAELVKKLDKQKVFTQLQASVNELESQTEETAEDFLAGKINEEQFMDQYMKSRVSFWLRKVKAEKMEELLNPTAPKLPPKRSQPQKPSPYRAADGARSTVQMPTPSHPRTSTLPSTQQAPQPPPTHQPPYQQPPTQQPYRQPVAPPVSAAVQAAPYSQPPPPHYQQQRPQYQYPPQRPAYQYPQQQPQYRQPQYQQPARPYAPQQTYRPPAYPQQPGYAPQPGYQQPRPGGYYPYQQRPPYYR